MFDLSYIPLRGDVVDINFNPQSGKEIWKRRPALVLSSWNFNRKKRLAFFCPITSKMKETPFEVEIPEGLKVHGVILTDQIKCFDWTARRAIFRCKLPDDSVIAVSQLVETIIWGDSY